MREEKIRNQMPIAESTFIDRHLSFSNVQRRKGWKFLGLSVKKKIYQMRPLLAWSISLDIRYPVPLTFVFKKEGLPITTLAYRKVSLVLLFISSRRDFLGLGSSLKNFCRLRGEAKISVSLCASSLNKNYNWHGRTQRLLACYRWKHPLALLGIHNFSRN